MLEKVIAIVAAVSLISATVFYVRLRRTLQDQRRVFEDQAKMQFRMMPDNCVECGAPLAGSWTKHGPRCEIGKMIKDFPHGKAQ